MRKYLVAALAATAAIGVGTAAAQTDSDTASLKVTLSPKKAGTKKHPKNTSVHFVATNNNSKRTLHKLEIQMPKTFVVSGKGFKACNRAQLEQTTDPSICPKQSHVGGGVARAVLGVNTDSPQALTFDVDAYVVGKNRIDFHLTGRELALSLISPGKVSNTKKGPKLTVKVPQAAQEPTTGVFAGLKQLDTKLKGKAGKHELIGTTGCKHHKQKFSTKLFFGTNPVTSAKTISASYAAKCK